MNARFIVQFVAVVTVTVTADPERVQLHRVNGIPGQKNLDSSSLEFDLKRSSVTTRLKLQENRRLNANAPVFNVMHADNGKRRLARKPNIPPIKTRFFQDKMDEGAFVVTTDEKTNRSSLSGNLRMGDDEFELKTLPRLRKAKSDEDENDFPSVLEIDSSKIARRSRRNPFGKDHRGLADSDEIRLSNKQLKKIRKLRKKQRNLSKKQKKKQPAKKNLRTRRSEDNYVYALELIIYADSTVWREFYQKTAAGGGLTQEEATELKLREHFVHIVNGMSLRFQRIDDPEMDIYLTISGFIFDEDISGTNPQLSPANITVEDDVELVESQFYLETLQEMTSNIEGLENNDLIVVFTNYDMYLENTTNKWIAGLSYRAVVCTEYGIALVESTDYFRTVSVATHEAGHALGSYHDGDGTNCTDTDQYIMAPFVASFAQNVSYTPNPWLFSNCTLGSFKEYISSLGPTSYNCLLDGGDYYNAGEYTAHGSQLPGQLHTANEQCVSMMGNGSYANCTDATDNEYCLRLVCNLDDLCYTFNAPPARGTDCGETNSNTYCIDGQCVEKSDEHLQGAINATNNTISDACVDVGYGSYTCAGLDDFFNATYSMTAVQWCQQEDWEAVCCDYCAVANAAAEEGAEEEGGCTDSGYYQYTCGELDALFLANYSTSTLYWCHNEQYGAPCCDYCAVAKAAKVADPSCVDDGIPDWTCEEIDGYYRNNVEYTNTDWCFDYSWLTECCAYCLA